MPLPRSLTHNTPRLLNLQRVAASGVAVCFLFNAPVASRAEGNSRVALAVTKASTLETNQEAIARGEARGTPLAANTLLVGETLFDATSRGPAVWSVEMLDGSGRRGFVLAADVVRVSRRMDSLQDSERTLRRSFGKKVAQPPLSIQSHDDEQLREAWKEATEAIALNDSLPATQKLPDPYFARAEVYLRAGDVIAALDDCALASAAVGPSALDSGKRQQFAEIYSHAIKLLRSLPQPPNEAFPDIDVRASEHFNASQRFIAQRDFDRATSELTKALSLTPSRPLYWYMRAIARRNSGDLNRAQSDALFGALFEGRLSPRARHDVSKGLTRVQGPERLWLEAYRRGKAEMELMGLDL